ncbi:hypothetical protein KQH82_05310 [bacterium]|nr:hypothetical protein [bacterium]
MKALLIVSSLLALFCLSGCSDDDCATCPDITAPAATATYSVVGYWEALECEGHCVADAQMSFSVTLRRDHTYTQVECTDCTRTVNGRYSLQGDTLTLTPIDAPPVYMANSVWICQVGPDFMCWRRGECDTSPAWLFVRSTSN